jgi:hypothetical protein
MPSDRNELGIAAEHGQHTQRGPAAGAQWVGVMTVGKMGRKTKRGELCVRATWIIDRQV